MNEGLLTILISVAAIGFLHTITGPDHYLPFIAMARARNWNLLKTIWVTTYCGIGHVGSSIVIGIIALIIGKNLTNFEELRGNLAAWALILFGFGYMVFGVIRAVRNKPHKHIHFHKDGSKHEHEHIHKEAHGHVHNKKITPWILFVIFVLGPCEPLFGYFLAAGEYTNGQIAIMATVFSVVTLITMLAVVILAFYGFKMVQFGKAERYMHIVAGAIICFSGVAIAFLGL